jgi:hypothetical protein
MGGSGVDAGHAPIMGRPGPVGPPDGLRTAYGRPRTRFRLAGA